MEDEVKVSIMQAIVSSIWNGANVYISKHADELATLLVLVFIFIITDLLIREWMAMTMRKRVAVNKKLEAQWAELTRTIEKHLSGAGKRAMAERWQEIELIVARVITDGLEDAHHRGEINLREKIEKYKQIARVLNIPDLAPRKDLAGAKKRIKERRADMDYTPVQFPDSAPLTQPTHTLPPAVKRSMMQRLFALRLKPT